jgi:hemerythrin-like domain-containing protein
VRDDQRGDRGGLEMLDRSHRRLEERLASLIEATEALASGETDGDHVGVVDDVLGFLERAASRHELDEEESLFPRLRGHAELAPLVADLLADHDQHRRLLADLLAARRRWPAAGPNAAEADAVAKLASSLDGAYRVHIEREDRELLPAARAALSPADQAALLSEMDHRRGR